MNKFHKNVNISVFLIIVASLMLTMGRSSEESLLSEDPSIPSKNGTEDDLWSKEPSLSKRDSSKGLWWLKGYDNTESYREYKEYTSSIGGLIRENDPLIEEYYVNKYVNAYNNTVFLVITDTSPEIIEKFNDKIPIPEGVNVIYRKSPYNYVQLKEWIIILHSKEESLESKGVNIASLGVSENGTINIGIEMYTNEKGAILVEEIEDVLPKGILSLRNVTRFELD